MKKKKQKIQKQKQKQKQSVNVKIEIGKSVLSKRRQYRKRQQNVEQQQQPIQIQPAPVYYQMTTNTGNTEIVSALRNLQEELNKQRTIQPLGSQRLLPPEIPQPTLADMTADNMSFISEPLPQEREITANTIESVEAKPFEPEYIPYPVEQPRKFRPPEDILKNMTTLRTANKPDIANAAEKLGYGNYEELILYKKTDLIKMLENELQVIKFVSAGRRKSEKSGEFTRPKTIN